MKRSFFIIIFSLFVFLVNAQKRVHTTNSSTQFGLKGGFNVSNLRYGNANNPDAKLSFHVGALAHIHVNKSFAIQPELLFSGQGATWRTVNNNYKTYLNLNYINLPILLQYMVNSGFRVETGPQLGVLVSAHSKTNGNSFTIKDNYRGYDFSWLLGLGYITASGFGIDARYNIGFSNINDISATKVNNRVLQIGVFYQFK